MYEHWSQTYYGQCVDETWLWWCYKMIHELSHPCLLHIQYIDHLQNKNPTWIGQDNKIKCDQNQILFLLIKDEATYSWWISLHCNFLCQTSQLILICDNSMPLAVTALHPQEYQMLIQSLLVHHQGFWTHFSPNICKQSDYWSHSSKGHGRIQILYSCWPKVQLPSKVIS